MITICLSTYNGAAYLDDLFASLQAQSYQQWRLLIRDDGSTDTTLQIIEAFSSKMPDKIIHFKDNGKNLGSSQSFMRILEHVQTPYIMFCDQDDVWINNKIELTLEKMQELERSYGFEVPLLVFTDMKVVDSKLNLLSESFWSYQRLDPNITCDWKKLLAQNVIAGCTIMINQAAKKVALPYRFDEMLHDHWIGVQIAKYGKIASIATPTMLYRQHNKNVEGAHHFGWRYIGYKLRTIASPLQKLYRSSVIFSDVSFLRLLFYKLKITIQRVFAL